MFLRWQGLQTGMSVLFVLLHKKRKGTDKPTRLSVPDPIRKMRTDRKNGDSALFFLLKIGRCPHFSLIKYRGEKGVLAPKSEKGSSFLLVFC